MEKKGIKISKKKKIETGAWEWGTWKMEWWWGQHGQEESCEMGKCYENNTQHNTTFFLV